MRITTPAAAASIVALVALAGCSGGSSSSSESGGTVELSMLAGFTGDDRAAYEGLVDTFNETHDDIHVTLEIEPWDSIAQTLPTAWATGQGADIAALSSDPNVVADYLDTGSLLALDRVGDGEDEINVDALYADAVDAFTTDGTLYAVPANVATLQLYYNKTLFEAAGVEVPTTVEELQQAARDLTSDGVYGLSLAESDTIAMWPVLQWLEGADVVDEDGCSVLDSDASIASLTSWADLVLDGAAPVGLTGAESDSLFSAGKAAMQINGPWAAAGYTDAGIDLGVAAIPTGVDGDVTLASIVPMAISASTEHPDEAQEFLAWWTGQDAQKQFALASGYPTVRTDLADDPDLAEDTMVSAFVAALPSARLYLSGVTQATKVDSEGFIPLIGEITRGADVAESAAKATATIDALTGCA